MSAILSHQARVHDRFDLVVISEGNSAESRLNLDLTPTQAVNSVEGSSRWFE
jgi:hypothetical protein